MRRYISVGATIGLAIPFLLWAVGGVGHIYGGWLWPSSILLLLTDGRETAPISWFIILFAIFTNLVLYSIYGLALFGLVSLSRRLRHRA
jgi:hypothetical protein